MNYAISLLFNNFVTDTVCFSDSCCSLTRNNLCALMASNVASAVYFIQLKDISATSTENTAGDLWLFNSDELISAYDSGPKLTDTCFFLRCCSIKNPEKWERVSFPKDCMQFFHQVDRIHFDLLLAVTTPSTRLTLLKEKQGLLKWAATLSPGCRVSVQVRISQSECEFLTGVIRYAGHLQSVSAGWNFGIELDPEYEGKGTTNGEFRKHKYFECKEDCAVFVSVDKLKEPRSSLLTQSDSTYFSDQTISSSSEIPVLLRARSVDDMVQTCALAINDRVVWMSDNGPEYGTVRWIGVLPDAAPPRDANQLTVGVEFDNPVGSGTGRYHSQTLFTARRRHASLVPIMGLMKESDLEGFSSSQQLPSVADECADSESTNICQGMSYEPLNTCTTNVSANIHLLPDVVKQNQVAQLLQAERHTGLPVIQLDTVSLTNLSSVDHKGCILPPSVADADVLCSINRGIHSYSDTCALEVIIFVLFAFYSFFDNQLFAKPTDNLVGAVKSILVEQIVNPLRATYFVSADKMRRFGELFAMIQSAKLAGCATSSITLSDDPSGTITTVLCDLLQVDPLIAMSDSSSYVYSVDVSQMSYPFPSLQHVIECSVVKNPNRRLMKHPQSVFIVNVDSMHFGQTVTCGRIFPGLILDISGILHYTVHPCRQCGRQGSCICGGCFTDKNMQEATDAYKLSDYVFCAKCFDESHKQANRQDHQTLPVATAAISSTQKLQEHSLLELFAIVSYINGHYVSFLKVGAGDSSAWLAYDGMAAVGRSSRHNSQVFLPEIKRCQEIETWLKDIPASQRADTLPDVIVKLTSGLCLCFYRPRHL